MNYKVAIVDDEDEARAILADHLHHYTDELGTTFEVAQYRDSAALFAAGLEGVDIFILDINIPTGDNGLAIAGKIRLTCPHPQSVILFCTHYAQYAIRGYEVDAAGYLLKPINDQQFLSNMRKAVKILDTRTPTQFMIKTKFEQKLVNLDDLVYVEVCKHDLFYYIMNDGKIEQLRVRGAMSDVRNKLDGKRFARCGISFLVNLSNVMSIKKGIVYLRGGVSLCISRKFHKEFGEKFMEYMRGVVAVDG